MKKNYFLLQTLLVMCLLSFPLLSSGQRDVYLIIGQSNAAGRGAIEAEDMAGLSGVDLYNGTTWESAQNTSEGFNRYSSIRKTSDQGLNFAYTFSKTINELTGNQIGVVVNARGGTSIIDWAKGASAGYYSEAIIQINNALALGGSTLKGILWHQGEANRNSSSYLSNLSTLIADLRSDLSMPDLPIIVGQISKQRTDNEVFNTNIKTIADSGDTAYIPHTEYATTDGLQTLDRTHFNSNGQRVLGYRYAAKALKMIYGYTYVENQIIYVTEDSFVRGGAYADEAQEAEDTDQTIRVKNYTPDQIRKSLLKFNINDLTGTTARLVVDATLMLNGNAPHSNTMDIDFYDIDTTWSENTVTENNLVGGFTTLIGNSTTTFDEDQDDDDGDGDDTELVHGGADLTEFIKDKYDSGTSFIALGLKTEAYLNSSFSITTKEDATNFATRPHLIVSYIDTSSTLTNGDLSGRQKENIKISYTNPVKNELQIKSNFNIDEVRFYSITGQHIKSQKVNSMSSLINTSGFAQGSYILVIKNNDEKIVKLLVKR